MKRRNSFFASWGQWAFYLCLLPLVAAAHQLGFLGLLPFQVTAVAVALLLIARSTGWPKRFLALDLVAVLVVGIVAIYFTTMGDRTSVPLALILAVSLVLGSINYGGYLEHGAEAERRLDGLYRSLHWNRGLAFVLLILGLTLATSTAAFGPSLSTIAYTWLVSSSSFGALFLLFAGCLVGGRFRPAFTVAALLILEVAAIWAVASTEIAVQQAYPLLWDDLLSRADDRGAWGILLEGLVSWPALFLTLGVFVGFGVVSRTLARLRPRTCFWLLVRVLAIVLVGGGLLVHQGEFLQPKLAERYLVAASAPWAAIHERDRTPSGIDIQNASDLRARLDEPVWDTGPAVPLDSLAGRYPGRSMVLVVLESHSLNNVSPWGENASHYNPSSPYLSRLMTEGFCFTNYFAAGFATRSALWAILTGLPDFPGAPHAVQRAPEATRLGRMPDFQSLGYRCDWLCPASPRFDNWDRLMSAAGVRWWMDNREVRDLPRTYWTSWGMPDGELYSVALGRYRRAVEEHRPVFMGILTVSNHFPYSYPTAIDGERFTKDHPGGIRYADYSLRQFISGLWELPTSERPILFVTSDSSYIENLRDDEPVGNLGLEGLRIPGLLLLPDGYLGGERYEEVFCHEDVLDLLHLLVVPAGASAPAKFVNRHRKVGFANGHQVFTRDTYLASSLNRWFEIVNYWGLEEKPDPPSRRRTEAAWAEFLRDDERIWPTQP